MPRKKDDRLWALQLNLDSFNYVFMSLDTDIEMAMFLRGLAKGFNGAPVPVPYKDDQTYMMGYTLGAETLGATRNYRENKSHPPIKDSDGRLKENKIRDTEGTPKGTPKGTPEVHRNAYQPITNNDKPINNKPTTTNLAAPEVPLVEVDLISERESEPIKVSPIDPGLEPIRIPDIPTPSSQDDLYEWVLSQWNEVLASDKSGLLRPASPKLFPENLWSYHTKNPDWLENAWLAIQWCGHHRWDLDLPSKAGNQFSPPLHWAIAPGKAAEYAALMRGQITRWNGERARKRKAAQQQAALMAKTQPQPKPQGPKAIKPATLTSLAGALSVGVAKAQGPSAIDLPALANFKG